MSIYDTKEVSAYDAALLKSIGHIGALVKKQPEIFDFSKLDVEEALVLLDADLKFFQGKIKLNEFPPNDKAYAAVTAKRKPIRSLVSFSAEELKSIESSVYFNMLKVDFSKYILKEAYEKMPKRYQMEIFILHPEWVKANCEKVPTLTLAVLDDLSRRNSTFVDTYVTYSPNFDKLSIGAEFWIHMIKFNSKYKDIFIKNTKLCSTKTVVRHVIERNPELIKLIDTSVLENSKLTCKDWVLLADKIMNLYENRFSNWVFSEEIVEAFKLELTADMLSGKSKISKRFQNAMQIVFPDVKKETENTELIS